MRVQDFPKVYRYNTGKGVLEASFELQRHQCNGFRYQGLAIRRLNSSKSPALQPRNGPSYLILERHTSHKTAHFSTASHLTHAKSHPLFWPDHDKCFYEPFIPDLPIICLSPNTDFQLCIIRKVERSLGIQSASVRTEFWGQSIPAKERRSETKKSYPCSSHQ
jgi:hypothetical protein